MVIFDENLRDTNTKGTIVALEYKQEEEKGKTRKKAETLKHFSTPGLYYHLMG